MYIPMTSSLQTHGMVRLPSNARDLPPTRLPQLEHRLQDILSQAIMITRFVMIAIGMSALAGSSYGAQIAIMIALGIAVVMMVAIYRYEVPFWLRLAGDGAVVALLVTASGGVMSPVLALPLLLIPLGALHGGVRDSIASTCIGLMLLLMIAIFDLPMMSASLAAVLFVQFVTGVAVSWLSNRIGAAMVCLYTGVQQTMPAHTRAQTNTERYAQWQHEMLGVIEAERISDLLRMGRQVAFDIVGATVDFHISGEGTIPEITPEEGFRITNSHASQRSVLVVHCDAKMVDRLQYDALAQLLTLVQLRSMTLSDQARHERDQQSMQVLWQMVSKQGEVTAATNRQIGGELCEVLGLRGMCMIQLHNDDELIEVWHTDEAIFEECVSSGYTQMVEAVSLQQMRAMTYEQEQYMVLPTGQQQAVIIFGDVDQEDTQRILMMFADMVMRFVPKESVR